MSMLTCGFNSLSCDESLDLNEGSTTPSHQPSTDSIVQEHLRTAIQLAQSRARQSEEQVASIFAHVDREMKAAVKQVHRAKHEVRRLRVATTGAAMALMPEWMQQRSASDSLHASTPTEAHRQPESTSAGAASPHPYLAALATPLASPMSSPHASLSRISASMMPSLQLAPAVTLVPPAVPVSATAAPAAHAAAASSAEEVKQSTPRTPSPEALSASTGDESFCLLPFETASSEAPSHDSGSSTTSSGVVLSSFSLPHSNSRRAMLEASEANDELHRDTSPLAGDSPEPSAPSSVQNSPTGAAFDQQYPSYLGLAALHTSSSNTSLHMAAVGVPSPLASARSMSGSSAHVLANSSYHISPSAQSPPVHPATRGKKAQAGASGLGKMSIQSPLLQPQSPVPIVPSMPTSHTMGASIGPGSFTLVSGSSSQSSIAAPSAPPQQALPPPALSAALRTLKDSQLRFETLAQFCAPLLLQSHALRRLHEDDALTSLGVLEAKVRQPTNEQMSDEELSASTELQMRALSPVQRGGPADQATEVAAHEEEQIDHTSDGGDRAGENSSVVFIEKPSAPSSASPGWTKEDAEKSMQLYIRQLRAEILSEDQADSTSQAKSSSATDASATGSATAASASSFGPTMAEALEGCVLLHQQIMRERETVERLLKENEALRHQAEQDKAAADVELAESRAHYSEAKQRAQNMSELLARLNIPLDEKGRCAGGEPNSCSFWQLTGLTLAFGSLLVVSALSWRRVIAYLAERFADTTAKVPFTQHFASAAAHHAKAEAATQTAAGVSAAAAATAGSAAEAATQFGAQAASSAPVASSGRSGAVGYESRYREYSLGPIAYGHHTVADGQTVIHSIDVLRFPRFMDFVSRVSLQFVAAVA